MNNSLLPRNYKEFIGLGAEIVSYFCLPIGLGYWVDLKVGTGFLFTVIGAAIGFVLFFMMIYRIMKKMNSDGQ